VLTRKDVSVINGVGDGEFEHLCGSRDLHPCLVPGTFNVVPFCSSYVVSIFADKKKKKKNVVSISPSLHFTSVVYHCSNLRLCFFTSTLVHNTLILHDSEEHIKIEVVECVFLSRSSLSKRKQRKDGIV